MLFTFRQFRTTIYDNQHKMITWLKRMTLCSTCNICLSIHPRGIETKFGFVIAENSSSEPMDVIVIIDRGRSDIIGYVG